MSQDVNSSATNGSAGGLKSTLKVVVPIVALMGVIFGVTFFAQYTQKPVEKEEEVGGAKSASSGPPLVFFNNSRMWDPPNLSVPGYQKYPLLAPSRDPSKEDKFLFSVQDRVFAGFFEPDKEKTRSAAFWFENRNPNTVTMQLKGVSCSACSGGRLASIPPEVTRAYLQRTALAALPIGTFNAFGVGLADPAADFSKLDWTKHKFSETPDATYKVAAAPATPDKWAPQWGIMELTFSVAEKPNVPLRATFATQVDGAPQQVGSHEFSIYFAAAEPCAVSRPLIEMGEVNQLTGDREYTFLLFSATRGPESEFGDLDTPKCEVQAPPGTAPGQFVEVTKIERLPNSDLLSVEEEVARGGRFSKVQAAYRVTVAVRPKIGDARLDIGLMERTIYITAGGAKPQSVKITATVRGSVWLATGKTDVTIPTFKGRAGTVHTETLVTETTGMELALVEDECKPRFIKYELVKKEDRGGQGYYELKTTVPPGRQYGAIDNNAIVVVEVKGPKPQRIRIPVKGSGEQG
ncbi:hypothetical protein J8F10_11345 [Gemmata sp. G18]|uniref:DUF1573 domain-containing protein n=1 Tax=Gemmata palustris TaxID=2822762 RepID=A0ABS5BRH0_9BACT|nr:hypothetical protein [Gemmata palustris]MBP3955880.1 hypothetical protein [Gemmata palustris]